MKELTFDEWVEQYKPVTNPVTGDIIHFETFGDDLEILKRYPANQGWTFRAGDGDCITNGYGWVNRMNYYLTEVPWEEDETIVITW